MGHRSVVGLALNRAEVLFVFGLGVLDGAELAVVVAGLDERQEERVRFQWLRFELGVELASEEVGVVWDLDDLDVGSVGRGSGDAQSSAGEQRLVFAVEFVAMPVVCDA